MQRIYDSKEQKIVDFVPLKASEVGMYVCGPTVQSAPHIGHLRSALAYDVIRRWFIASGNKVTFVRNVTDIDDKILDGAEASLKAGAPEEWWALAYRVEREFTAAYDAIGVMAPTYEPRATANITQMIDLIETLIDRGHAYVASDGSANVFFNTRSWSDYGSLTNQSLDDMDPAGDSDPYGKKDPRDFALWKAYKSNEPESAAWSSPWGLGRPGWHIECSAMAKRYLGSSFDIHGGGLDLRFPHHENEQAQSNAVGDDFANHWMHNGLVNTGGQKMSKSLGNSLFASDLIQSNRPIVLRYFLLQAHYRSVLEYTKDSLQEAGASFSRIERTLERFATIIESDLSEVDYSLLPSGFTRSMNDDFSVPEALAVVHGNVTAINIALENDDKAQAETLARELVAMLDVLGVNPTSEPWQSQATIAPENSEVALSALVNGLLQERREARESKDFDRSDEIRNRLEQAGIALEDTQAGTRWSVK